LGFPKRFHLLVYEVNPLWNVAVAAMIKADRFQKRHYKKRTTCFGLIAYTGGNLSHIDHVKDING
jgi:hypothetical protein